MSFRPLGACVTLSPAERCSPAPPVLTPTERASQVPLCLPLVLRQNSVRRQVIDLAGLIQRKFGLMVPLLLRLLRLLPLLCGAHRPVALENLALRPSPLR